MSASINQYNSQVASIPSHVAELLYGPRRRELERHYKVKEIVDGECIIYPPSSTVVQPLNLWYLKNIIVNDKRLAQMFNNLNIKGALSAQTPCWPQMDNKTFPFVCIAPRGTGKTYTYLIYIVSKCITRIPIVKTDEILSSDEPLKALQDALKPIKRPDELDNLAEIDHDKFDFNSLGKKPDDDKQKTGPEENKFSSQYQTTDECEVDENNPINIHPKYIIVCSSQTAVERVGKEIDKLKIAAFGIQARFHKSLKDLPPSVRTIDIHQSEKDLVLKCTLSEIIVTTPVALLKCLREEYLKFSLAKMVIFDDLDLMLQTQNSSVREVSKFYLMQTQEDEIFQDDQINGGTCKQVSCQLFAFSRKWTYLVQQFMSTLFKQKTVIFRSRCDATVYADLRYELEFETNKDLKTNKVASILKQYLSGPAETDELAIYCNDTESAGRLSKDLESLGFEIEFLHPNLLTHNHFVTRLQNSTKPRRKPIYVLADETVDYVVEYVHKVTHIIHYSFPEDFLIFDHRFRLMHENLRNLKRGMLSTVFLNDKDNVKGIKELYDIISRSVLTLNSTRLELRDFINDTSSKLCWRWATTGLCRMEKLSRRDRFGSYCFDRHSVDLTKVSSTNWPKSGQFKITVSHIVSPSVFYFWFEEHRDESSPQKQWRKLEDTGFKFMLNLEEKLNKFRSAPQYSIPLKNFKKNKVYGIYLPSEEQVYRITLMSLPEIDHLKSLNNNPRLYQEHYRLVYENSVKILKIDYGNRLDVFLKNVFELPEELTTVEAQARKAFNLGIKPADNESDWIEKSTKQFKDTLGTERCSTTVWIRFQYENCFWFESMLASKQFEILSETQTLRTDPNKELCRVGLAEKVNTEPSCLAPSKKLETLSKWHVEDLNKFTQYAFLKETHLGHWPNLFVLQIKDNLDLLVRHSDFNKQLIQLEAELARDFEDDNLKPLHYFSEGIYCLVRIIESYNPTTKQPHYVINRCKIVRKIEETDERSMSYAETLYEVFCLDHGDKFKVKTKDMYLAAPEYLSKLPFQAIECKLADLNRKLLSDPAELKRVRGLLYDYTRDQNEDLLITKCSFKDDGSIYLYIKIEKEHFVPLIEILEAQEGVTLIDNDDPNLKVPLPAFEEETEDEETKAAEEGSNEKSSNPIAARVVEEIIRSMLLTMIERELHNLSK